MNRPVLYKETVDILYQAYFNDTLHHQYCAACAVGNIIAARMGYIIVGKGMDFRWHHPEGKVIGPCWSSFVYTSGKNEQTIKPKALDDQEVKEQIEATGYEPHEVAQIEFAFETAYYEGFQQYNDEVMFNGLCRVLDCLAKIHEVTDEDLAFSKQPFQQHHQTKQHGKNTTIPAGR